MLAAEVAILRQQLNRNSGNSSQPPSSERCSKPPGAFGPRLQAMAALLTGRYHLRKRATAEVMTDFFRAEISLGAVPRLEQRPSAARQAPVAEARAYIQSQPVLHLDETGWREANQKGWLWLATTSLVTVFFIRASRGGAITREILGTACTGIVVSDRWSAYNWLLTLLRQLCWVHLLRDFQAFVKRGGDPQLLGEALLARAVAQTQFRHPKPGRQSFYRTDYDRGRHLETATAPRPGLSG